MVCFSSLYRFGHSGHLQGTYMMPTIRAPQLLAAAPPFIPGLVSAISAAPSYWTLWAGSPGGPGEESLSSSVLPVFGLGEYGRESFRRWCLPLFSLAEQRGPCLRSPDIHQKKSKYFSKAP